MFARTVLSSSRAIVAKRTLATSTTAPPPKDVSFLKFCLATTQIRFYKVGGSYDIVIEATAAVKDRFSNSNQR
jgi:hypothetical protein